MQTLVDARTRLVGLLGDPVEQSLSPLIHNTAFAAAGIPCVFAAFRVPRTRIEEAVRGLLALRFLGASVTVPHKESVLPCLDVLSSRARAVGAANVIACRTDETLFGDNTDVDGFLAPLLPLADRLRGSTMVILGAGGAARAVAYALLTTFEPERLVLVARTTARAERLAADFSPFDRRGALEVRESRTACNAVRRARLVVNATPLGMYPAVEGSAWPESGDFGADHIVYDLVYNPEQTRLLREAVTRGSRVIGGLGMLVSQAAVAFSHWTGRTMPTDVVREALRHRMG